MLFILLRIFAQKLEEKVQISKQLDRYVFGGVFLLANENICVCVCVCVYIHISSYHFIYCSLSLSFAYVPLHNYIFMFKLTCELYFITTHFKDKGRAIAHASCLTDFIHRWWIYESDVDIQLKFLLWRCFPSSTYYWCEIKRCLVIHWLMVCWRLSNSKSCFIRNVSRCIGICLTPMLFSSRLQFVWDIGTQMKI